MNNNIKQARQVLETCINAVDSSPNEYALYEIKELMQKVIDSYGYDEFNLELCGGEVRLIHESDIDEIWTTSLIEQIKECYDLPEIPNFVAIDWEQTAKNCKVDGMGHHFSLYDGQEHSSGSYHIFRTN